MMKKLFFSFALMLASLSMSAQTSQYHTVQRGETIESVAMKYSISASDLQQANPSTKNYFYAGMKLVIPHKANTNNTTAQSSNGSDQGTGTASSSTKTRDNAIKTIKQKVQKSTFHSKLVENDFTSVSLTFGDDFTDLVGMTYGIQGQYFLDNGIGATLAVVANYGLEEDADVVMFKVGPSYVYPLTNMFYVMGTACYTLTWADTKDNTGKVSGVSAIPTIGMSFNRIKVGINCDLHWRNGGDFGAGAYLSVGYSF